MDSTTAVSSMAEIEASDDFEYTTIPGFKEGQTLDIGSLTAGDLIEWTEANEGEAKRTAGLRLICKSLVTSTPDRVRYASDSKNIAKFRNKSHKVTQRIVEAILKLNGLQVKGANEAAKND